jgi:hypothetical protein
MVLNMLGKANESLYRFGSAMNVRFSVYVIKDFAFAIINSRNQRCPLSW